MTGGMLCISKNRDRTCLAAQAHLNDLACSVGFPCGMDFAEPDELWKKYVQSQLFQPDLPQKHTMSTLTLSTVRQSLSKFDYTGLGLPALVLLIMAMLVVP